MTSRYLRMSWPKLEMIRSCRGRLIIQLPHPRMHFSYGARAGVRAPADGGKDGLPENASTENASTGQCEYFGEYGKCEYGICEYV